MIPNPLVPFVLAALFGLAPACMTRGLASDDPASPDAASPDASPADGFSPDRAPKLPPPSHGQPVGATCAAHADCASGACADGVCCAASCDAPCFSCNQAGALGTCAPVDGAEDLAASAVCAGASVCVVDSSGVPGCKLRDGQTCAESAECAGGACRRYYPDGDGDGYGATGAAAAFSRCEASPNPPAGFSATGGDCCDGDPGAHPSMVAFSAARNRCGSYDWNCSGAEERQGAQTCPNTTAPLACGQACSVVLKGSVGTLYVQACR